MAKDKKDQKDQVEEQDQQPKVKKGISLKWIIIISVALLIVVGGAVAGYFFYSKTQSKKPVEQKTVVITFWPMEAFVVNIKETDAGGERYLKLVIQLELSEPGAIAELEQIKPRLRDSILDLLTPKTYKELMDVAGKQRLREDIAGRVNNALTKGKVTRVYFTEFVVQ